ncbi:MAG: hypothetical protein K6T30_06765, partial [Alicyclobacillus sp.]|nr:hypothetical protein [Alicyclobacillus sp.]
MKQWQRMWKVGMAVAASSAMLGTVAAPVQAQAVRKSSFDWKRYSGQQITVLLVENNYSNYLAHYIK